MAWNLQSVLCVARNIHKELVLEAKLMEKLIPDKVLAGLNGLQNAGVDLDEYGDLVEKFKIN